jgi:preprotein translocase subunit SecE
VDPVSVTSTRSSVGRVRHLSSQQQSTGYKRRSSGKRSRRPTQGGQAATIDQDQSAVAAGAAEDVAQITAAPAPAKATQQSAPSRTSGASRGAKSGEKSSGLSRFVDTRRFEGPEKFIRESWAEIKKVNWPDRETTRNLTLVVIAVSAALGILLGGIDYVLFQLFEALP